MKSQENMVINKIIEYIINEGFWGVGDNKKINRLLNPILKEIDDEFKDLMNILIKHNKNNYGKLYYEFDKKYKNIKVMPTIKAINASSRLKELGFLDFILSVIYVNLSKPKPYASTGY
jgi:hypothetical protein